MLFKLIGLVIVMVVVAAASADWINDTQSETKTEFSIAQKCGVFGVLAAYVLVAYLLGLTPVGWIAPLILAVIVLVITGYLTNLGINVLRMSLFMQLAIALAACLAMGGSSVAGLKRFASTYLIFALITAALTVAASIFLKPGNNQAKKFAEVKAKAQAAKEAAKQTKPAASAPREPAQSKPVEAPPEEPEEHPDPDGLDKIFEEIDREAEAEAEAKAQTAEKPQPKDPKESNNPKNPNKPSAKDDAPIAGIIIGAILAAALIGFMVWFAIAHLGPAFGL